MGGAAGVIGTMETIASLKLPVNLTVIVPTVENMPSGTATRPADIVKSVESGGAAWNTKNREPTAQEMTCAPWTGA